MLASSSKHSISKLLQYVLKLTQGDLNLLSRGITDGTMRLRITTLIVESLATEVLSDISPR